MLAQVELSEGTSGGVKAGLNLFWSATFSLSSHLKNNNQEGPMRFMDSHMLH